MTNNEYLTQLQRLKLTEQGAIGSLKGTVAGLLLRNKAGFEMELRDWVKLQSALDVAETAHQAVVDHLCESVEF